MHITEKKKNYRAHMREQTLNGMVACTPKGGGGSCIWMSLKDSGLTTESPQYKDVYAGTMGKQYKRTHKKQRSEKATPGS